MLIHTPRDLGASIRERRKALGLDQAELASRAGTSRRWLVQVENGNAGASLGLLLRTLNVLDLHMSMGTERGSQPSTEEPLAAPDLDAILARARRTAPPK